MCIHRKPFDRQRARITLSKLIISKCDALYKSRNAEIWAVCLSRGFMLGVC